MQVGGSTGARLAYPPAFPVAPPSAPRSQVVFLNAGVYLSAGIRFSNKRNVTLRGAGPDKTLLVFSGGSSCGGMGAGVCFINGDGNWTRRSQECGELDSRLCSGRHINYVEQHHEFTTVILDQRDDPTSDHVPSGSIRQSISVRS